MFEFLIHNFIFIKKKIFNFAIGLQKFPRSITGKGNRQTLNSIKKVLPNLKLYNVKTGYKAFDWTVPDEWIFNDAYIEDPSGKKIVDAKKNLLQLGNYSHPIKKKLR